MHTYAAVALRTKHLVIQLLFHSIYALKQRILKLVTFSTTLNYYAHSIDGALMSCSDS
jgi:hypothetical protein